MLCSLGIPPTVGVPVSGFKAPLASTSCAGAQLACADKAHWAELGFQKRPKGGQAQGFEGGPGVEPPTILFGQNATGTRPVVGRAGSSGEGWVSVLSF